MGSKGTARPNDRLSVMDGTSQCNDFSKKGLKARPEHAENFFAPSRGLLDRCVFEIQNSGGNAPIMDNHIEEIEPTSKRDKGFTLVELLIVIVILGILATVTVFAVRGITDKGTESACDSDKATLQTATEAYIAQYGSAGIATEGYAAGTGYSGSAIQAAIAAPAGQTWVAGATPRDTLKNAGLLRAAPSTYFVLPDGSLVVSDAKCGTIGTNVG